MKKRRQRPQQTTKNGSTTLQQTQIHQVSIENNEIITSEKHYPEKGYLHSKNLQTSADDKTCLQSAKHKMALYFFHFLNYLQFDHAFTKQQFEALKTQHYIFKSKFPDNYYLSYEERAKTFGITIEQMMKKKEQDQENKNIGLWAQVKKFICCEGADQLEEADEMVTAASQSQFYYLTKAKYKGQDKLELTEESMLEKPNQNPTKNAFQKENKKMVRQKNLQQDTQDQFFFGQKQNVRLTLQDEKQTKVNNTIQSNNTSQSNNTNQSNVKQIDINAIKAVNKREHKKKENIQITQSNLIQGEVNSSPKNKRNKKNTQKVYVHRKSDDQNQQPIHDDQRPSFNKPPNYNQSENGNKNQVQKANHNSPKLNEDQQQDERYAEQISQISQIDHSVKINRNQSQSTLSYANPGVDSLKNTFKLKNQAFAHHDHSFDVSSNNQSTQKMLPFNSSIFENSDPTNFFQEQNMSSFIPLDDSDIISVSQSESQSLSTDPKFKKQNKRKHKRNNSQKSQEDLHIIQHQQPNIQQDLDQIQNTTIEDDIIQDGQPSKIQRNHNYSASSDHIGRKAKKNNFKFDSFDGLDFSIQEGKEEEDNDRQELNEISFDDTKSGGNLSERGEGTKMLKKKKTRNKKLFNLKEEEQSINNEVVFFPDNQNDEVSEKPESNTVSFDDSFSNVPAQGAVMKKKRKNKKIKDLSHERNDEVIVLEAGQMLEDMDRNDDPKQGKINQESQFTMKQEISGAISNVKAQKKKKRKAKLRQELEKQEQELQIVDLGQMN